MQLTDDTVIRAKVYLVLYALRQSLQNSTTNKEGKGAVRGSESSSLRLLGSKNKKNINFAYQRN